jgi:hypothetical protein
MYGSDSASDSFELGETVVVALIVDEKDEEVERECSAEGVEG